MDEDPDRVAADLIARARRSSGLSQTELARRSGLDRSMLSAYERRRRQPSVSALARILAAAGAELALVPSANAAGLEHSGRVLAQVLDLAEALPSRSRDDLEYPRLIEMRP